MTFAQRLDGLLIEHDLSVLSLIYMLGIPPTTVYSWFRHEAEPDTETVRRIVEIFHCGKEFFSERGLPSKGETQR